VIILFSKTTHPVGSIEVFLTLTALTTGGLK
jgi:hypothetical protein